MKTDKLTMGQILITFGNGQNWITQLRILYHSGWRAGDFNNYSYAGFEFTLKRHIGKYIVYNHMPSGLFVCISWISFVVPIEVIPGRMALLITLLLVLINIFNSIHHSEPLASGITAVSGICKSLHQKVFSINKWNNFVL